MHNIWDTLRHLANVLDIIRQLEVGAGCGSDGRRENEQRERKRRVKKRIHVLCSPAARQEGGVRETDRRRAWPGDRRPQGFRR